MKWEWLVIIGAIILCPILLIVYLLFFQKPYVSLKVNGEIVAFARQPFFEPIFTGSSADVYIGKTNIFSLREDFFDGPNFIYPFVDGKRFLCDYDDDVALLDFVVDFGPSSSNKLDSSDWPLNERVRADLSRMDTNVVFNTKGVVRLPNAAELQEVATYLTSDTPAMTKAGYFGIRMGDNKYLLLDLATNRQSIWPLNN